MPKDNRNEAGSAGKRNRVKKGIPSVKDEKQKIQFQYGLEYPLTVASNPADSQKILHPSRIC